MSFKDCIQSSVDSGRVSSDRGAKAQRAFDDAYEQALAEGLGEAAAAAKAADGAVESITNLTKAKRWSKINEMQRAHEIHTRLFGTMRPDQELDFIMRDLENSYDTVRSMAMANQDTLMLRYKPQLGGFKVPQAGLHDIVRASYGDKVAPEYKLMADAIKQTDEMLVDWANMYGASIPKNPNYRLSQTQDQVKVSAVTEEEFVNDMLEHADYTIMRYAGKEIKPEEAADRFKAMYSGIVSDGMNRETVGQSPINLINRLNRERFFYYKSADSWIAMQEKYGSGNVYEQFIGHVDAAAKDISLLKTFGPNPESMKEFTKRMAERRASEIDLGRAPNNRGLRKKTVRQAEVFQDLYDIHSRHVPSADGNWPVQAVQSVRTVAVGSLLGGIFVPSLFGDLSNSTAMKNLYNIPEVSVVGKYFKEFIPNKENIQEAVNDGVIFESAISLATQRVRYFGALDGSYWARRYSDVVFRMGLASHHTQTQRNAEGKQLLSLYNKFSNRKFDDVPFAAAFVEQGITPADWDMFRKWKPHEQRGAKLLRPIDMWRDGNVAEKKVAEKFSNFMQHYIRMMVPDPNLRSRRAMGEAIDPNSAMGQFARTATTLMSFPVSILFNQLSAITRNPGNRVQLLAKYMAWMTVGGAFITQAKALVSGQELYDMTLFNEDDELNLDFWGRAFLNGGSLGILGDFLFNNINMNNSPYRQGNPTEEYFRKLHKLLLDNPIDAAFGDDEELNVGKDTIEFLDANFPDFWYSKLIIERAFLDEINEWADPAGHARAVRWENEHEEGMWWGTGDDPRLPNPQTAAGDY